MSGACECKCSLHRWSVSKTIMPPSSSSQLMLSMNSRQYRSFQLAWCWSAHCVSSCGIRLRTGLRDYLNPHIFAGAPWRLRPIQTSHTVAALAPTPARIQLPVPPMSGTRAILLSAAPAHCSLPASLTDFCRFASSCGRSSWERIVCAGAAAVGDHVWLS